MSKNKLHTEEFHENCFACGQQMGAGLKLKFQLLDSGDLYAEFKINKNFQGYDNISHGGIISTILDSSMVNLFYMKEGLKLKTAKLNICFRKPVPVEKFITIKAVADNHKHHFYRAKSQILSGTVVLAEAEGYFRK